MIRRAFKDWLASVLQASLVPAPASYPYNAAAGVIHAAGFTTDDITVLVDRPAAYTGARKAVVIVNVPAENEEQYTQGGPMGEVLSDYSVELDVLWVAQFTPDLENNLPAVYTNQADSDNDFDHLVMAVQQALRLVVAERQSPSIVLSRRYQLTDSYTGYTGSVKSRLGKMETIVQEAAQAENSKDLYYGAMLSTTFKVCFTPNQ